MSHNFQVIFQSRTSDGVECEPDMVLFHGSDMKQIKVKSGGYVTIETGSAALLCRAWTSKKCTAGVITLNKIWSANFSGDSRKAFVKLCSSPRVTDATSIILSLSNEGSVDYSKSIANYDFVLSLLKSVPVCTGTAVSFTYRGTPLAARISSINADSEGSQGWFRVTLDSNIKFDFVTASANSETRSSSSSSRNIPLAFAGYEQQKQTCLHHVTLGLAEMNPTHTPHKMSFFEQQLLRPPRGLLLYGPPGTGKTRLMHCIVQTMGCHVVEITPSILMANVDGEAEQKLRDVFVEARRLSPCCILIDNMDLVCASRSRADVTDLQKRLVSCLLTLLDGVVDMQRVFLIGTTARPNDIDPAIRRAGRIDKEVEISVPSAGERYEVLCTLLSETNVTLTDTDSTDPPTSRFSVSRGLVKEIASLAHGMVGADLLLVVKEAFYLATKRRTAASYSSGVTSATVAHSVAGASDDGVVSLADEFSSMDVNCSDDPSMESSSQFSSSHSIADSSVTTAVASSSSGQQPFFIENDFRQALTSVSPSALREVVIEVPQVRWTDIGGMESVKQSLREVVEWPLLHPELFQSLNISPPKGVLLYGPPGCSKTLMAKALATESSMNFLAVRGPELLSKWLGDSEKAVQTLFRRARAAAPSIIFFDEIDALAGKRGATSAGVSDRVLSQLLTELDGIQGLKQVIVIAATNRPDMLDAALIRPGRIDRKIYVPPPDEQSREQILRIELGKMPISSLISFETLVNLTEGFSGAECVALCAEAAMLAIEEGQLYLSEEHLLLAIRDIKPQITPEMINFYETFKAKL